MQELKERLATPDEALQERFKQEARAISTEQLKALGMPTRQVKLTKAQKKQLKRARRVGA